MTTVEQLNHPEQIPGYAYGTSRLGRSPVSLVELAELEAAAGVQEDDVDLLRRAADLLLPHAADLVDQWRARLGGHDRLARHGAHPDGAPHPAYAAASHPRFARWVIDLCTRPHDQAWLDQQHEIGRRHTSEAKNTTDDVESTPYVPLRHVLAFVPVVLAGLHGVIESSDEDVDRRAAMKEAITRSVMLHVTLWTRPYMDHPEEW